MKPMGWSPTHRDLSLGASVEQGPSSPCLTLLCASGSTGRRCPESVSVPGSPVLTLTMLIRIRLSHTLVPHKLSSEWISSFLSCCCASRLDLPAGLTPSSICWCFCTANANRKTSPTVFFPSLSLFYLSCPTDLPGPCLQC